MKRVKEASELFAEVEYSHNNVKICYALQLKQMTYL